MRVTVDFPAGLPPDGRHGSRDVELPPGATAAELLAALGAAGSGVVLSVNGREVKASHRLREGDACAVLVFVCGG